MKAQPLRQTDNGYEPCAPSEATHVRLNTPGPFPTRILPVILKGRREGTACWSWNGDIDKPTLKPSIHTTNGRAVVCHSFVNDGRIQFLADSTHEFAGQTLDLLDIDE